MLVRSSSVGEVDPNVATALVGATRAVVTRLCADGTNVHINCKLIAGRFRDPMRLGCNQR